MAKAVAPHLKFNNGLSVPILGLGTWKSAAGQVYEAVKTAILDSGYRHIDCAFAYNNEDEVGKAIDEVVKSGKVTREELFITSKVWNTYHSKERVHECFKITMEKLGIKYLDLYLVHWPMGFKEGGAMIPVDENGKRLYSDVDYLETWKELENLVKSGHVKSIGVSNFSIDQLNRLLKVAEIKPVVNQVESHPYLTNSKLIEFCHSKGIQVTAYSPLGSPDRPWAKPGEATLLDDPAIKKIADKHNKTSAQILIKFQVQRQVIVIPKSVTKERIHSNMQVFDFELSDEEMDTIKSFDRNHRFVALETCNDHPYYPF